MPAPVAAAARGIPPAETPAAPPRPGAAGTRAPSPAPTGSRGTAPGEAAAPPRRARRAPRTGDRATATGNVRTYPWFAPDVAAGFSLRWPPQAKACGYSILYARIARSFASALRI